MRCVVPISRGDIYTYAAGKPDHKRDHYLCKTLNRVRWIFRRVAHITARSDELLLLFRGFL